MEAAAAEDEVFVAQISYNSERTTQTRHSSPLEVDSEVVPGRLEISDAY